MQIGTQSDLTLVISGEAGQGLQTLEGLLVRVLKRAGYYVCASSEVMSRIRGGNNSSMIRLASHPVGACVRRIDLFIALCPGCMERFHGRLTPQTVILGEKGHVAKRYLTGAGKERKFPVLALELSEMAGGERYVNTLVLGLCAGLCESGPEVLEDELRRGLARLDEATIEANLRAAVRGYAAAREEIASVFRPALPARERALDACLALRGVDAVSLGALCGGCNFVAGYPMSPSTGVLTFLARHARDFGVIVEQAEDEIAAVNMALGAWYAGARALVTTSGGGFALMTEGLSLAGCIESPLVVHLGQRPGPATGLPTRTEQADLTHALYAGHGEFPRIVLAPGTLEQGFALMRDAFDLADRFQVPVFVLTDQFLLDSWGLATGMAAPVHAPEPQIVAGGPSYRRYAFTEDGISPRAIPGLGSGCVCVDSDEHDEYGRITEDFTMREAMVRKRLRKGQALQGALRGPTYVGPPAPRCLAVGWGSTWAVMNEALALLERDDIGWLHFSQVWPLPLEGIPVLMRAVHRIAIEGNATGQFAGLLSQQYRLDFHTQILKFNGRPFEVEEVCERLADLP